MAYLIDKSLEGRMARYFPHYWKVPKGPEEHVRWRQKMFALSKHSDRKAILQMCSEDFLFYINTFTCTFEARGLARPVPFNTYPFQDELAVMIYSALYDGDSPRTPTNPLGQEDLRVKKPRAVGATVFFSSIFEHCWRFGRDRHILFGSRSQDELDRGAAVKGEGSDVVSEWTLLMPKLDFIHLHQPKWVLAPGYVPMTQPFRKFLTLSNPSNGCVITAASASPNFGRGRRYFAIFYDEYAHTDHAQAILASCGSAAFCHFWVSTPRGPETTFATLGRTSMKQANLEWTMHPEHFRDASQLEDGRWTSPWYESECRRLGNNPILIAQELDANEETSGTMPFYPGDIVTRIKKESLIPFRRVDMEIVVEEGAPRVRQIVDRSNGKWMFWFMPDASGMPPKDTYFVTADVAMGSKEMITGSGASNSVIAVFSLSLGMKVAQYVHHGVPPHKLAVDVIAAQKYFRGEDGEPALACPESNGPGQLLIDTMMGDYGWHRIWWNRRSKTATKPGFCKTHGENGTAKWLFGTHLRMLADGRYVEPDIVTAEEMVHYVCDKNGAAVHGATQVADDPSGARDNHGDRVIASALGCLMLELHGTEAVSAAKLVHPMSYAAVVERREREALKRKII